MIMMMIVIMIIVQRGETIAVVLPGSHRRSARGARVVVPQDRSLGGARSLGQRSDINHGIARGAGRVRRTEVHVLSDNRPIRGAGEEIAVLRGGVRIAVPHGLSKFQSAARTTRVPPFFLDQPTLRRRQRHGVTSVSVSGGRADACLPVGPVALAIVVLLACEQGECGVCLGGH